VIVEPSITRNGLGNGNFHDWEQMIGTIEDTTALSATGEREARMDPKLDTPKAGGHDEWIYSFFENPPAERPEEEAQ